MNRRQRMELKKYLLVGLVKGTIVEDYDGKFLIDKATINHKINFNCINCHKAHGKGHYCCNGTPFAPMDIDYIENIAMDVIKTCCTKEEIENREKFLEEYEFQQDYYQQGVCSIPFIEENGVNNCFFFNYDKEKDCWYCSLHRYALLKGLNPFEIKPQSCSLFPMESIQVQYYNRHGELEKEAKFLCGITKETEKFCRGYNPSENRCCYIESADGNFFKEEDYIPLYKANQEFIKYFYGDEIYKFIENIMKG